MSLRHRLPLTLWEEFFLEDDHENYPASFAIKIKLLGRLDPQLLIQSLQHCLRKHPLFDCVIQKVGIQFFWIPNGSASLPVEIEECETEPQFRQIQPFDVSSERLWRIRLSHYDNQEGVACSDLFIEFHHSLCDGLGAIQFCGDIGLYVDRIHFENEFEVPKFELQNPELKNRGVFAQSWAETFKRLPNQYKSIMAAVRMVFRKVESLVPVKSIKRLFNTSKPELSIRRICFPVELSSALRRNARKRDATANILISTAIFQSIAEWKSDHGHEARQLLRIMMPFNERGLEHQKMPACNRVSFSPLTRNSKKIEDTDDLVAWIESTIRAVKQNRLGYNFHRALAVCKLVSRNLKPVAATDRIGATCMYSNLGNIQTQLRLPFENGRIRCGPVKVLDIQTVPPLRFGTSFALVSHEFDGETRLDFQFDPSIISAEEFDGFLEVFQRRLTVLATVDS